MFTKASDAHCRFCGASLAPEEVYKLEVPFFERAYEVCKPCRDAWAAGSRELNAFEPRFRADRVYRWPGPIAEDALALARIAVSETDAPLGELAGALETLQSKDERERRALPAASRMILQQVGDKIGEAGLAVALAAGIVSGEEVGAFETLSRFVDRIGKSDATPLLLGVYAHATAHGDKKLLEAARSAYLLHLSYTLKTDVDGRIAALHALASLELGDRDGAAAKLRQYRRQADATPAARDPRIPLLQARVYLAEGNLAAVDDALAAAIAWAKVSPRWAEIEALAWFDTYVRAVDAERWEVAKDALKAFCKLRPDDRRALNDLGHAFMKCALDRIAREVLASYHARDPKDKEGVLLYATCLARLDDTRAAWTLLRDDLESESEDDLATDEEKRVGAERRHLAALVAEREGHSEKALELLESAHRLAPEEDDARENLVTLLLAEVGRRVDELTPENFGELVAFLSEHKDALEREYGAVGLAILRGFIAREIRDDFKTAPSFGLDLFEKLRFGDTDLTSLQAYELLAQRKLGDAVRKDRQAQQGGGRPIPIELLLRFLQRLKTWPEDARRALAG